MNNRLNTIVSFYDNITCVRPDEANLYDLLTGDTYRARVLAIRNERSTERQKRLKNKLPLFTPSGLFLKASAKSLLLPTGLICVDIDGKDNTGVNNFDRLKELITGIPYVMYCGLSVRGAGYFCIIPISLHSKFKQHFHALQSDFARCGVTIDKSCSDISRKRFVSYDPDPYINLSAETYTYVVEPQRARRTRRSVERAKGETAADVERVIAAICDREIDITGPYGQWFEICCALANEFGEPGREMFHTVSRFGDYDFEQADRKYNEALKGGYDYSIGTFFHCAGLYGVNNDDRIDAMTAFQEYLK
ncbi:MAG: PriCT-2 domain-containing protein [Tannerellaceae bacterium]|jgi:hypothetical protein|nr:PriCT-2 domain-containing protein [Tannerellaceae bacterium]